MFYLLLPRGIGVAITTVAIGGVRSVRAPAPSEVGQSPQSLSWNLSGQSVNGFVDTAFAITSPSASVGRSSSYTGALTTEA